MSLRALPNRKPTYAELEAEVELMREQMTVIEACRAFDRFHAFDGLQDDHCPACGGPVTIEETNTVEIRDGHRMPPGKRLAAVPW